MNKLIIVLLAICLVSVHAFVKRETEPLIKPDTLENLQKQWQETLKTVNDKVSETFNPEEIKKNFNSVIDALQNVVKDLEAKKEAPKN
ncbi:uncharacterized protein [Battus philenor]|uniref:uncharacterized protein n=1 Tax=Battus philenor TaxID=42288 RepID=UPI0035CEF74D